MGRPTHGALSRNTFDGVSRPRDLFSMSFGGAAGLRSARRLVRLPLIPPTPLIKEPNGRAARQIYACKSIDRLIADSEIPAQRLHKTLGRWSLTALGVGAIIGSGIFVLTGTAAAGEHFETPSMLHASAWMFALFCIRLF